MTPTEKHRADAARVFLDIVRDAPCADADGEACWSAKVGGEIIAAAIANAEREGMKRAAEIAKSWGRAARSLSKSLPSQSFEHAITADMADDIASAILSQAGEG